MSDDDEDWNEPAYMIAEVRKSWDYVEGAGGEKRWIQDLVAETEDAVKEAEELLAESTDDLEWAWDDVHGGVLRMQDVRKGRKEEV